ncbi:MAG: hypothetical protein AAF591_09625 [Verrucomicrobiota bacterium]
MAIFLEDLEFQVADAFLEALAELAAIGGGDDSGCVGGSGVAAGEADCFCGSVCEDGIFFYGSGGAFAAIDDDGIVV